MQALGLAEDLRAELESLLAAGALEEHSLRKRTVIVTALNTLLTSLLSGKPLAEQWAEVVSAILEGEEALEDANVAYRLRTSQTSEGSSSCAATGGVVP